MRGCEGLLLHATVVDLRERGIGGKGSAEKLLAGGKARDRNIGDRDLVAVTIKPRLLVPSEMVVDRQQPEIEPVARPFQLSGFVDAVVLGEQAANTRRDERMCISGCH